METAGVIVLGLVCALAYFRYSLSAWRSALFTSWAFLALALTQVVFGILLSSGGHGLPGGRDRYFWYVGWLVAGTLVFLASWYQSFEEQPRRPALSFFLGAVDVVIVLGIADGVLWTFRNRLPALLIASPAAGRALAPSQLHGLTAIDYSLGTAATFIYLAATLTHLASLRIRGYDLPWLPPALVVGGFSQLHYMFFPALPHHHISTGDFLRAVFSAVLLIGLIWELRQGYLAERKRAADLATAYEMERRRVQELEHLDRAKAELFNVLTHELLHPVAAIRGFTVTLHRRWTTIDDDTRFEMIERMDRESDRLRHMAEGAVTAMNLEHSAFSLVPSVESPADLVREAAGISGELDGRLEVIVPADLRGFIVAADRARILQVFRNLLSNAQKYSEPHTLIRLEVRADDGEVTFTVTNRGPGVAPEDVPRLFQRFSRIRTRGKEDVPGSGLGLYISKMIVERHRGRIWIESEPGLETAVSFALPRFEEKKGEGGSSLYSG